MLHVAERKTDGFAPLAQHRTDFFQDGLRLHGRRRAWFFFPRAELDHFAWRGKLFVLRRLNFRFFPGCILFRRFERLMAGEFRGRHRPGFGIFILIWRLRRCGNGRNGQFFWLRAALPLVQQRLNRQAEIIGIQAQEAAPLHGRWKLIESIVFQGLQIVDAHARALCGLFQAEAAGFTRLFELLTNGLRHKHCQL